MISLQGISGKYYSYTFYGNSQSNTVGEFPLTVAGSIGNTALHEPVFDPCAATLFNSLCDGANIYNVMPSLTPNTNGGQATFTTQDLGEIGYLYN